MAEISIIVPVYQTKDYVETCVRSFLAQRFSDWEMLLVDDGSDDGSGEICDRLAAEDARIRVIHQENGGVSRARNRGLKEAAGRFICFADSDDRADPGLLAWFLEKKRKSSADIVCCGYVRETSDGSECPAKALEKTLLSPDEFIAGALGEANGMLLSVWIGMYPADLAKSVAFREDLPYGEDSLWLCEVLSQAGSVYYEPEPLYHYLITRDGNTATRISLAKQEKVIEAAKAMAAVRKGTGGKAYHHLLKLLTDDEIEAARLAHAEGKKDAFRKHRRNSRKLAAEIAGFADLDRKERLRRRLSAFSPVIGVDAFCRLKGRKA